MSSREEGTPAYKLDGQIDEQVKQDRYDILMEHQLEISERLQAEKVGKRIEVLIEAYDAVSEAYSARTSQDAPDIDGKVFIPARRGTLTEGDIIEVEIIDALDYDLVAKVID